MKKSNENDDFSLLKSGPVVCNLLRHSTSSASLFNNFMHRGHKKRKVAGRLVRMWWQVPIQTLIINGGWSEARTRTQSLSPALKKHIAINCHPIFIFCQSVCAARLIPHTKHLWHNREGGAANVKICRDMHARTLSTRITKAAAECTEMNKGERRESSDGCHGTSHFSNLRIIFDRVSGV